jgi:chromate transporter
MTILMTVQDWWTLFVQFCQLSLLGIGGAITTAPEMHRFLVDEQHWLNDAQFTSSIALAQASPGPNVLFVAVMGWNVGLNAGGGLAAGLQAWGLGVLGVLVMMLGIMLPSSVLTYTATRWAHRNQGMRGIKAFKAGMAPIVVALLICTGWLLTAAHNQPLRDWPLWVLTAGAALLVWRTRIHLLWLLAAGALLGAMGLV